MELSSSFVYIFCIFCISCSNQPLSQCPFLSLWGLVGKVSENSFGNEIVGETNPCEIFDFFCFLLIRRTSNCIPLKSINFFAINVSSLHGTSCRCSISLIYLCNFFTLVTNAVVIWQKRFTWLLLNFGIIFVYRGKH